MPEAAEQATPQVPEQTGRWSLENHRQAPLLVVDDQPVEVVLLTAVLGSLGYTHVRATTDPAQVVPLYLDFQPDLIILDLHMPKLDGFAVMRQLRERIPAGTYLPILVLTADTTRAAKERALALGARDFLTKPFDQTEVAARVRNLLQTRFLHLQLHARLLEEQPTGRDGRPLDIAEALALLEPGQLVNTTVGAVAARPVSERIGASEGPALAPAAAPAAQPRRPGTASPANVADAGDEAFLSVGEVLTVRADTTEVFVAVEAPAKVVEALSPGEAAAIDFTDALGTYDFLGVLTAAHGRQSPSLAVAVRRTMRVQLRRFVRVPVHISPRRFEVERAPGLWREVPADIIDLSVGGMGVLAATPLRAEARLEATFALPGRLGELLVRGHIVPVATLAERQEGGQTSPRGGLAGRQHRPAGGRRPLRALHRYGVKFTPLPADDLKRLQRALYARQLELRRLR